MSSHFSSGKEYSPLKISTCPLQETADAGLEILNCIWVSLIFTYRCSLSQHGRVTSVQLDIFDALISDRRTWNMNFHKNAVEQDGEDVSRLAELICSQMLSFRGQMVQTSYTWVAYLPSVAVCSHKERVDQSLKLGRHRDNRPVTARPRLILESDWILAGSRHGWHAVWGGHNTWMINDLATSLLFFRHVWKLSRNFITSSPWTGGGWTW